MADKKISQLTGATTPLAGTEVLPIVQSGSTVKVSSDDLTVKNVRSNATSGILQVAGPGAGATRTMTVPDANFTVARTDAGQTFTGTQTFAAIGTAGNANLGNSANNVSGGGYTHRFSGRSISPDGSTWLSSYGAVVFNAGVDYTGNARRYLLTNALDQKNFAIIRSVDGTTDPALGNGGGVSSGTADFVVTYTGDVEVNTGNVKIGTSAKGVYSGAANPLTFGVNNAEKARLTANGFFKASDSGTYNDAAGDYHEIRNTTNNTTALISNTNASFGFNVASLTASRAASVAYNFIYCTANSVDQFYVTGTGVIYAQNGTVQTISDARLKENIRDATEGLDVVKALRPVRYDWKKGHGNDRKNEIGFLAQEIETVFPDAVSQWKPKNEGDEAYKTVGQGALIPVLVKAIQEQQTIIDDLKARVAKLENP